MINETKRDVFDAVWNRLAGYQVFFNGWPRETLDGYKKRYDNALPDDLPVIPKAIGEYITSCKAGMMDLHDSMFNWLRSEEEDEFMDCYSETFALAWLLGVWRVEETGEIVKIN